MLRKLNKKTSGFTLIELLVVVLILAILMAVALPLYLNAVADSQLKTCRSNLQTIANAVQAKYVSSAGATPYAAGAVTAAIYPDLQASPVCPKGGAYTTIVPGSRGAAPFATVCSFGGGAGAANTGTIAIHGEFDPGVDAK